MTSHSVVIAWRTFEPDNSEVVFARGSEQTAMEPPENPTSMYHAVHLQNLSSGTVYRYQIQNAGKPLTPWISFKTFPESATAPFSFVALGDSGTASTDQKEIAARITQVHPDLVIHTGDVIYGGKSDADFDQKFFSIYRNLLREIPFFLTLGNHDVDVHNGEPYLQNFYLPQNSPDKGRYYSFDCGEAHFISLNSNASFDHKSLQYQWLKNDLAGTKKPLKIVFFHHPLYSSGYHGSSMRWREDLKPLFEKDQVTLVFNGHDHDYERTKPIHGITYVVTGGGGAPLYPALGSSWTADTQTTYNFVYVQVFRNAIHLETIDESGNILDHANLNVQDTH